MIDVTPLLKIFPIFAVFLMVPGPDFMIVSSMTLSRGPLAGLRSAAGVATSVCFYALLSLCGLSALFSRFLWLALLVKGLGGLYLIYLGVMVWRSANDASQAEAVQPSQPARSPYLAGLLTNLANPKAVAFFTSIFALALTPAMTMATQVALLLMMPLMAFAWFSFVAAGLSHASMRQSYARTRKAIDRIAGSIMIIFGIKLVSSEAD
jgi:threonine efflux protein